MPRNRYYEDDGMFYHGDTDLRAPTCVSSASGGECTDTLCNPDERYHYFEHAHATPEPDYDAADDVATRDFDPTEEPPEGRRWIRAGVELEGAWNLERGPLTRHVGTRGQVKGDGSVTAEAEGHQGEVSTRPYKSEDALMETVKHCYPDVVNDSCGMHVHTSWTLGDYVRLARPEFALFFREKINEFAQSLVNSRAKRALISRLNGDNTYCRVNRDTDGELALSTGDVDRYRQINYSWRAHKTIECRLLPMFDTHGAAVKAVRALLAIYEEFLATAPALDDVHDATIEMDDSPTITMDIDCEAVDLEEYTSVEECPAVSSPELTPGHLVVMTGWSRDAMSYTLRSAANQRIIAMVDGGII